MLYVLTVDFNIIKADVLINQSSAYHIFRGNNHDGIKQREYQILERIWDDMIIYRATKQQFNNDVIMNQISDKILAQLRLKKVSGGEFAEYRSCQNSLIFMRNVIDDNEIPDESTVAIEYQIPQTSKRFDFIIAGADNNNHNNVVVIELKQWEKAEIVAYEMQHGVRAFTGGANRIVSHPSYQAYSYSGFIRNSSE